MIKPTFDLIEECKDAKNIIVTGHIKPDGDCVGSTIAVTLYLRKRLPSANVRLVIEKPASFFDSLTGIDIPEPDYAGAPEDTDICIVLDTSSNRIGGAEKFFKEADKTINIDHHISNREGSGTLNYVDPDASSASELVYWLIDKEYMDAEIAKFIYLGIAHDTGVFRYSSTSSETHRIAADLIGYDFNFSDLLEKTYYEKTYEQAVLIAGIVEHSRSFFGGKVVFGSVGYKEYVEKKLTPESFDGAINDLRIIKGCECAIFMYPMNEVTIKVSMRSTGTVDVSRIGEVFGGGGHKRASGFYYKASEEDLLNQILSAIEEQTGWER